MPALGMPGGIALKDLGYERISGLAAAKAFTAIPAGTVLVQVIPQAQAVRWRADGVDPTAAIGMPIAVGVTEFFNISELSSVKFIEQAASAVLNVNYYGA